MWWVSLLTHSTRLSDSTKYYSYSLEGASDNTPHTI
jgi:hypothetical protein